MVLLQACSRTGLVFENNPFIARKSKVLGFRVCAPPFLFAAVFMPQSAVSPRSLKLLVVLSGAGALHAFISPMVFINGAVLEKR